MNNKSYIINTVKQKWFKIEIWKNKNTCAVLVETEWKKIWRKFRQRHKFNQNKSNLDTETEQMQCDTDTILYLYVLLQNPVKIFSIKVKGYNLNLKGNRVP